MLRKKNTWNIFYYFASSKKSMKKYGLPYMGSKREIAQDIVKVIAARHPRCTDFYDLFGGGGAVSMAALDICKNWRVNYNEIDANVVALLLHLRENGVTRDMYKWVSRDAFFSGINGEDGYWKGFLRSVWSFGNVGRGYIYGKEIEKYKYWMHSIIVDGVDYTREVADFIGVELGSIRMPKDGSVKQRRLYLRKQIGRFANLQSMKSLENLQSLQRLERLESMERLQSMGITNLSYEDVVIAGDNPVIYCDIPYIGVSEYATKLNHDKFYEWASQLPYPVYVSEYKSPFSEVEMWGKNCNLAAFGNAKKTVEKLFFNGYGKYNQHTLFY